MMIMMASSDRDVLTVCSSKNTSFVSAQTILWFAGEKQNCTCTLSIVFTVSLALAINSVQGLAGAGVSKIKEKLQNQKDKFLSQTK